jgi:hypothetical protein
MLGDKRMPAIAVTIAGTRGVQGEKVRHAVMVLVLR